MQFLGTRVAIATVVGRHSLPDRPFLELALLEEIRETVRFPQGHSVSASECEIEFAPCVGDERIGCCLRSEV